MAGEKVTGGTGELVVSADSRTVRALAEFAFDKTERAFWDGDDRAARAFGVPVLGGFDIAASRHSPAAVQSLGVTVT
jgi:hypothetical protein